MSESNEMKGLRNIVGPLGPPVYGGRQRRRSFLRRFRERLALKIAPWL